MESEIWLMLKCTGAVMLFVMFPIMALIILVFCVIIYFLFFYDAPVMPEDYDEPIEKVDERRKRDENNELN